jgi:hypothetical protein
MRSMFSKLSTVCAVSLAVCAVSAGAAQAALPTWHTGGKELSGTLNTKPTFGVTRVWNLFGVQLVIVCQKGSAQGGRITQEAGKAAGGKASGLTFESCKIYHSVETSGKREVGSEVTGCTLPEGIATVGITDKLSEKAGTISDSFAPTSGETLTNLGINGPSCTIKGRYLITGGATGSFTPINTEAKTISLSFNGEGSLKLGGNPLELETTETIALESGASFGIYL